MWCQFSDILFPVWSSWRTTSTNTHFLSPQDPLPVHLLHVVCQSQIGNITGLVSETQADPAVPAALRGEADGAALQADLQAGRRLAALAQKPAVQQGLTRPL